MRDVTRQRLHDAYVTAVKAGDHDWINGILLRAIELDADARPGETRLMDILRNAAASLKQVA